ncbi:MAG TPA: TlpA disulfide reductase family protein [Dehalococcoidia bacterium]|nr:TlpA disulfide reductase family protein [Dehalococcoidia bacterium]
MATTEQPIAEDRAAASGPWLSEAPSSRPRTGGCARFAIGLAAVVLLAVLIVVGQRVAVNAGWIGSGPASGPGGPPGTNTVGQNANLPFRQAPDFTVESFTGETVRLSDFRGRPVLINYWAAWCEPCRAEAPLMERIWREYRDRGVVFLGIDIWDDEKEARAFLERYQITYPSAQDLRGTSAISYGVRGIPESFFIDREGQLVRKWTGPFTEASLRAALEEVLAAPATG